MNVDLTRPAPQKIQHIRGTFVAVMKVGENREQKAERYHSASGQDILAPYSLWGVASDFGNIHLQPLNHLPTDLSTSCNVDGA